MTTVTARENRSTPWEVFLGSSNLEGVTAFDEAIQKAGLNFDVEVRPAAYRTETGGWRTHPGRSAVVRTDTDQPLGSVSSKYEPLQYRDAFAVVKDLNPVLVAGGSPNGGKQGFMVVQDPRHQQLNIQLRGVNDPHDLYLVLRSSHDGSKGLEVVMTTIRPFCMNQMAGILRHKDTQRWYVRHSKNASERLTEVERILKGVDSYIEEFEDTAAKLAAIDLELDEAREVIDQLVPEWMKSRDQRVDTILDLYQHSETNGFTGTGWGLVNALTEFSDHRATERSQQGTSRWTRGLDGETFHVARRATRLLLER